ncbi:MAG TPA: dTDP-4-dehydrorhamnose 3,5-epimerase [Anaerolineae bacterium]
MNVIKTNLPDVLILEPQVFADARGFFMETYNARKLAAFGITASFVQDNHSRSQSGTLRGLHYQIRQPQGKLIRVAIGEVFDVAVDLRRPSPTFGQWTGAYLSAENKRQIWIPPGFAHGFYAVSEQVDLLYKATDFYAPEWERTLLWNDPRLNIDWPLIPGQPPMLSAKDLQGKNLDRAEVFD